jgi:hypothetical protein
MPWWSGLGPEAIRDLHARYPGLSLDQIGIEAMQRLGYADEFAQTGAKIHTDGAELNFPFLYESREFPMISVPARNAAAFGNLVVAVMLARDEPAAETDDLVGGEPYSKVDYIEAGKLHAKNKMTIQGIENHTSLKQKRAYRIWRQFKAGAVLYEDGVLRPGPGYPFELDNDPPRYKLIRR